MTTRMIALCTSAVLASMVLASPPAGALTMKECSAKYKAAQTAGTLKGQKWSDFRKAECGTDASAAPAPAATQATAPAAAPPRTTTGSRPSPAAAGSAVFPTAVAPKYSKESEGKARMHTCLDQYNANKASNANGGMNWIQRGGGYYSECNKRLKG
ncbi:MAG: hypothetical protein K2Z80_22545 [Xanthobacteraceae bacterium]|nr:hypothetical protein [Xanthobacteraceae bacterium]